ncbi:hypothetical protein AAIR98_001599 [Elusimicrobium simillimum]
MLKKIIMILFKRILGGKVSVSVTRPINGTGYRAPKEKQ